MSHQFAHRGPADPGDSRFGGGPAGGPRGPAGFPAGEDPAWSFTISDDLVTVTAASVGTGDEVREIDISDITFATLTGTNDLGMEAVVGVSETRVGELGTHTRLFDDQDGDGLFARTLDLYVASNGEHLRTHSFAFDDDGNVIGEETFAKPGFGWPSNVSYETVTVEDDTYVVKTVQRGDRYAFEISRDDDDDGVWSVIAAGVADIDVVDASTQLFDIDDIATYLATASSIIG